MGWPGHSERATGKESCILALRQEPMHCAHIRLKHVETKRRLYGRWARHSPLLVDHVSRGEV